MRCLAPALALLLVTATAPAAAQVLSYTTEQATDGARAYDVACVACHTADLSGSGEAPSLIRPGFWERWNGHAAAGVSARG